MLNSTSPKRTGRRAGATDTRGAILTAARELFAERGLEGTSVRGVAARAGVDPSLVLHFFGSKSGLFDAALEPPVDLDKLQALVEGPRSTIGRRAVEFYVKHVFREKEATVLSIVRSAVTNEEAAARLRTAIEHGPLAVVEKKLQGGSLRAEMFASMMIGLFLARKILRVEPIASLSDKQLVEHYGPLAQQILTGGRR